MSTNSKSNNISYDYGTPNDYEVEVKVRDGCMYIEYFDKGDESWITIEDKYYITTDIDKDYFCLVYKCDKDGFPTDEEVVGEEKEEVLEKYDKVIKEAGYKIAQDIIKQIEYALRGRFYNRELSIQYKQYLDVNPYLWAAVYHLSHDFILCIDRDDMKLKDIKTTEGIIIKYNPDENNRYSCQSVQEHEVIPVNQRFRNDKAYKTFEAYLKDYPDGQDCACYEEVDIVTDKKVLKYFPEDEDYFYFEGHKIEKWSPSIGCADSVYIIR